MSGRRDARPTRPPAGDGGAATLRAEGLRALERGELDLAERTLAASLMRDEHPGARLNLAVTLNRLGRAAEALACTTRVLAAAPDEPRAWINHGMALKALARHDDAVGAFERAGGHPMARYNLGMVRLRQGDWPAGFALIESRKALVHLGRGVRLPEWQGEPAPRARLLVLSEQGLGDTILLARCLPLLARRVGELVMLVAEPLQRLLARSFPGVRFVTRIAPDGADLWVGALSLPHRLGVRGPGDLPPGAWLTAAAPTARAAPTGRLRVGINWAGNPRFAYDRARSTSLETLSPLLALPGIEWCSLHRGVREHEARAFGLAEPLATAGDFADTADLVAGLDLVVSTETAVPNLSGALGVPTWVMTPPDVDWRWCGWYPSVEAVAQSGAGDWPGVVERIAMRLSAREFSRAA